MQSINISPPGPLKKFDCAMAAFLPCALLCRRAPAGARIGRRGFDLLRRWSAIAALAFFAPAWGVTAATPASDFGFSDPYFEMVGDSESIPFGVVTAQAMDAKGLLWIGTQNGLVSYDGYRFNKYTHIANDPGSLAGDFINCIEAGADGRLWVGTNNAGLSVYDPRVNHFVSFHHDATEPASLADEDITAIVTDAVGGHWIGTGKGLDYRPVNGRAFTHYRHDPANPASLVDNRVRALLMDRQGVLWIGGDGGLQRLAPGAGKLESVVPEQSAPDSSGKWQIRSLFQAQDGKIWIGTSSGGLAWLAAGEATPHWAPTDIARAAGKRRSSIRTIAQPRPEEIWLGTFGDGIDIVSAVDGQPLLGLRHDQSNASGLALDIIGSLMADHSGQLWIGTWAGGLQRYAATNRAFRMLHHSANRPEGLSVSDVHSVLPLDDGRILVGAANAGIDILDRGRGLQGGYRAQAGAPGSLPQDIVTTMAKTADGSLWVGTEQSGLFRLPPGASRWQAYALSPKRAKLEVTGIFVTAKGELFVGAEDGLWHWRGEQGGFETYTADDGNPMKTAVYPMQEDGQGRIWAGTQRGLCVLEPGAKVLHVIVADPTQPDSLSANMDSGLLYDREGRLWVATESGLDRLRSWDGKHAQFDHISAQAGQMSQYFGSNLLEDKAGRIWSEDHLFDPASGKMVEITKADGMDIGTSWTGSYARTADGLFLFGGTLGVAVIDPDKFRPWENQPALVATELKINGIAQPLGALEAGLTLTPEQRNFSVEFAALDYSAPQKNRYSYRLLGYDDQWIAADAAHRSANYGNLWPGRYTLQVRGSNRLGAWSSHLLSIPVIVYPAFWQTTWFLALAIVIAASAVYGGYRWRLALLHAKARALQTLVDIRTLELLEKNRELAQIAVTDRLTKLYNRVKLDEQIEEQLARAERYGTSFALVLLDFDLFKSINDSYGHQVGDQVLIACANILSDETRDVDIVGRWGGEEFLVVACNTDLAGAQEMAEKLRKKVAEHTFPGVGQRTVSAGVTAFRSGDSVTEMMARADRALYRAKTNGRNRVECEP